MKKVVRGMYWVVRGEAGTRHGTSLQTVPYSLFFARKINFRPRENSVANVILFDIFALN